MSINSKLDALLAAQANQSQVLSTVLSTVQNIPGADTTKLEAAIASVDSHVAKLEAEIGNDEAPTPSPEPTTAPAA